MEASIDPLSKSKEVTINLAPNSQEEWKFETTAKLFEKPISMSTFLSVSKKQIKTSKRYQKP